MCICYTGWESDNTSTSNTTNSTILTINKCNKIIDGFLNNTITNNQNVNNTAVTEDSSGNSTQNNFLDNTNSSTLHITTTSTTSSFNWNSFLMYFGIASFVIITCSCCFCFIFKKIKNNMDDNQDISHTTKEANLRNIYSQPIYFIPGEKNDNQRPYNIEVLNDVYNLEKRKSTFHTPTKSKIENEDIYIDKRTYYPKSENKIVYLSNPPSENRRYLVNEFYSKFLPIEHKNNYYQPSEYSGDTVIVGDNIFNTPNKRKYTVTKSPYYQRRILTEIPYEVNNSGIVSYMEGRENYNRTSICNKKSPVSYVLKSRIFDN